MSDSTKTVELTIETSSELRKLSINAPANLLEALNAADISISSACGGYGTCTTCRIICKEGLLNLSPCTEIEIERAEERKFSESERLACQTEIAGDAHIFIPSDQLDSNHRT